MPTHPSGLRPALLPGHSRLFSRFLSATFRGTTRYRSLNPGGTRPAWAEEVPFLWNIGWKNEVPVTGRGTLLTVKKYSHSKLNLALFRKPNRKMYSPIPVLFLSLHTPHTRKERIGALCLGSELIWTTLDYWKVSKTPVLCLENASWQISPQQRSLNWKLLLIPSAAVLQKQKCISEENKPKSAACSIANETRA